MKKEHIQANEGDVAIKQEPFEELTEDEVRCAR